MKGAGFDCQFFERVVYCVDADKVGIEIEYENIDVYNILCVFLIARSCSIARTFPLRVCNINAI